MLVRWKEGLQCCPVMTHTTQDTHQRGDGFAAALTEVYGRHKGLNADWAVQAWQISEGYWILDNENGTFEAVYRTENADGEFIVESLGTLTP